MQKDVLIFSRSRVKDMHHGSNYKNAKRLPNATMQLQLFCSPNRLPNCHHRQIPRIGHMGLARQTAKCETVEVNVLEFWSTIKLFQQNLCHPFPLHNALLHVESSWDS